VSYDIPVETVDSDLMSHTDVIIKVTITTAFVVELRMGDSLMTANGETGGPSKVSVVR
jgi:hypothetical protein